MELVMRKTCGFKTSTFESVEKFCCTISFFLSLLFCHLKKWKIDKERKKEITHVYLAHYYIFHIDVLIIFFSQLPFKYSHGF